MSAHFATAHSSRFVFTSAVLIAGLAFGAVAPVGSVAPANAVGQEAFDAAVPTKTPGLVGNIPLDHNDLAAATTNAPPAQQTRSSRAALPDDNELVDMPDAALRSAVRAQVGGSGALTRGDLRKLDVLKPKSAGITDLTGLEYASKLRLVDLSGNPIATIEPMRGLSAVQQLNLSSTLISDIDPVSTMPLIDYLQFNWTEVADLEPLRGKTLLWRIELAGTKVADLDPVSGITNLIELYFQETPVSDLSPLATRTKLITLSAPNTEVSDLSPVAGFQNLEIVNVNGARVSDLTMIDTWPALRQVGFLNQRVAGAPAVASVTETTYRRAVATAEPFRMLEGVVLTTSSGATTTPEGVTVWSGLADGATALTTKVAGDPWPGSGATYSATLTYSLSRADFVEAPPTASLDRAYNFQLSVTDGFLDGPFALTSGEVPGLTVDATGKISGTPTELGTFPITVTRTDAFGNVITGTFTFTVAEPVDVTITGNDVEVTYGQATTIDVSVVDPPDPVSAVVEIDGATYGPIALEGNSVELSFPIPAAAHSAGEHSVSMSVVDTETGKLVFASGSAKLTVKQASTTTAVALNKDQKSVAGKVTGQHGTIPTGAVTLTSAGKSIGTATVANDGSYSATLTNWSIPKAKETRTIVAEYAGDKNHAASKVSVKVTVAPTAVNPGPCAAPRKVPVFADTSLSHKFYKEIDWMECMKYSTGWRQPVGKPLYKPQNNLERQAMAAFIYRMEAPKNYKAPKVSPFADVKPGDSFYKEIAWMYEAGLSTGWKEPSGKPTFRPYNSLSREAMAAFIYRMEAPKGYKAPVVSPMTDMKPGMSFYKEISWMYDEGLSTGNRVGATKEYWPKDELSRQAMAAFIYRLVLNYRPSK
ncbi:hypothetical protein G7066_04290 [Leucobacter coleopterorum]|uniref:SLH domain-containing protein n=1 Tax=Leucobacter coleopterorum TaxID=2714933 RepID=A0ABX6JUW7_9MICO|nr:Ig-like domain repeat protein [Leucobacter coleopterorum]QIM18070.1 hypothetical protein G7066_04290 [Leucobacter coleopterorum]